MEKEKPAIEGGHPVRKDFLVFGKPQINKEDINEVVDSLESGWIGFGPKAKKFEELFKEYIGCSNAISVNSCTSALFLSLLVLGIKKGDEVITSPLTFASTINVIEHLGAKPVFVDVEKNTGLIDSEKIEEKISEKTKAILPVHLYGRPCNMEKIMEISLKYNIPVVEDAAHAIETKYKNKKIGTIGNLTCFSFYATKNINTVEGGIITTKNNDLAEKLKLLRYHGIDRPAWSRYNTECCRHYDVLLPGYNFAFTDFHASLGIHQLERVEENLIKRKKLVKIYLKELQGINELILPDYSENNLKHSNHLFTILLDLNKLKINRNEFMQAMAKENIGTGIHFVSMHLTDYYKKKYGYLAEEYPNALFISERTVSLPLDISMQEKNVFDVIKAVKKIISYYSRK